MGSLVTNKCHTPKDVLFFSNFKSVVELIKVDDSGWNEEVLRHVFIDNDVKAIKRIPIFERKMPR